MAHISVVSGCVQNMQHPGLSRPSFWSQPTRFNLQKCCVSVTRYNITGWETEKLNRVQCESRAQWMANQWQACVREHASSTTSINSWLGDYLCPRWKRCVRMEPFWYSTHNNAKARPSSHHMSSIPADKPPSLWTHGGFFIA